MKAFFNNQTTVRVRAIFISERIDLRILEETHRVALSPTLVSTGASGCAVLFRYGAVVLFGLDAIEEASFLKHLNTLISEPHARPEIEETEIRLDPAAEERVEKGVIMLHDFSVERLQAVADILAKAVVLAYYETSIAGVFDRIEPLAANLQRQGRTFQRSRELLRDIGGTLLIQHKMVWRVELSDKPEILWERPELERLCSRLEIEYELRERHRALDRKLELISRTAQTLLELLQSKRSLRVEWYIVALILVEIILTLFDMFIRSN